MAITNGTSMLLYRRSGEVGAYTYKAVGHSTSYTLDITMATRDTSTKDSGNYVSREGGRLDVTGSADGLSVYDDGFGHEDMQAAIIAREELFMIFAQPVEPVDPEDDPANETPDLTLDYGSGTFVLTSVSQNNPDQENSTYSVSFESLGDFLITEEGE